MSDYMLTAEPWEPVVPDQPFRDWDDVLALDDVADTVTAGDDRVDTLTLDGAI